jgi:hypothetical protein
MLPHMTQYYVSITEQTRAKCNLFVKNIYYKSLYNIFEFYI